MDHCECITSFSIVRFLKSKGWREKLVTDTSITMSYEDMDEYFAVDIPVKIKETDIIRIFAEIECHEEVTAKKILEQFRCSGGDNRCCH